MQDKVNANLPTPGGPATTCGLLIDHYRNHPDRVCLYLLEAGQPDRAVTTRELMEISAGYSRVYAERGIRPGEVVILILEHGLDLIGAFWGAILYGAIPSIMPFLTEKLLPDRYRKDLAALVEVTQPAALVSYPWFNNEIGEKLVERGNPLRTVILSNEVIPVQQPDLDTVGGMLRGPDEIVFLQHSSGTTGLQKGVAISHRALLNQLDSYCQAIRLEAGDVVVSWLPLYHDMGLIAGFLMPILEAVPLVLMSPFDWVKAPVRLMQAVSRYHGTLTWLPNFAYNFCAQKIRDSQMDGIDLASWRAVINCSEPMHFHSFMQFAERFGRYGFRPEALATSYAMAENVFGVTQGGIGEPVKIDNVDVIALQTEGFARPIEDFSNQSHLSVKMLSCGRPIAGTEVRVVGSDHATLPERWVGELAVRSNCMLTGYYNRPDATASAFVDGWYLTGDLGYLASGEVYVTGRKKDLIIVGGRNIFPQDIEFLAGEVPGVHPGRVVAFGIYNEDLGTEEVALVAEVDLPEEQLVEDDCCHELEEAIRLAVNRGSSVVLRHIRLVGPRWMIKTSSGKTARAANREKFLAEMHRR